jgi:hypothetical protein
MSDKNNEQAERELFEQTDLAWTKLRKGNVYSSAGVQKAWEGWQARAALARQAAPEAPTNTLIGKNDVYPFGIPPAATTASASIQKLDLTDYSQAVNYSNNTRTAIIAPAPTQEAQAAHAGAVEKDATRYRWLRNQEASLESRQYDKGIINGPSCYHEVEGIRELKWGEELDQSIDAAIATSEQKGPQA